MLIGVLALGERLGIGPAARIAALAALGLGQQGIDLVGDGVALDLKTDRRIAQQQPEDGGEGGDGEDGGQHGDAETAQLADSVALGGTSPAKPMKASDMSPAVIRAMALPWKGSGTSATAMRSRMAANRTRTRENPSAAPKP